MEQTAASARDERVLLLTPTGADTEVAARLLTAAGIVPAPCASIADLCEEIDRGAGAIVVAEEALISDDASVLIDRLGAQPPWSDIPVVVLTLRANEGRSIVEITELFQSVGNMVLLERPFSSATLLVTIDMALRARRKQYTVRSVLESEQVAKEERENLLIAERAARAEAERASRMKDEFLATVSHELRTPLNAILGWSQLVRRESMDEADRRHGLETIERNARAQTQLIEDLLDMSRIVSGKLRLDVQPVEPSTFIEAAVETVRPAAEAKGIRLVEVLDPSAGPVSGDPSRLQQVVWNLLSNAIKFTPRGGRVEVVLRRVDSQVELSVDDTGCGIRADFLDHVFERFRQFDGSTTRQFGGLGLGLAIVKHLVELHGGTVRAASPGEGLGSTFTVMLPVTAVRSRPDRVRPDFRLELDGVERDTPSLRGVKVLAVDDEPDARELVTRMLADCGADVRSSGSAAEALRELEQFSPDVLISDIGMPVMDGYELLRHVRSLGGRIPAIALTAFARSEDRTRALRAGYLAHVAKPVEPAELIATVASLAGLT